MKKSHTAKTHAKVPKHKVLDVPKPKKDIKVNVVKKTLGKAPEEFSFVLADGRRLRSLFDLINALQDMDDDIFNHHVSETRNDFSSWVNDVFEEPELADELKQINSKLDAELILLRKLVAHLQNKK